tara:strand:+ start:78 stop:1535 length:1458 start_codon:yes stop_codon:yes gene_type:complete
MELNKLPTLRKIDPNRRKKKKILLLSDDLRLFSGIGTMSKEIVLNTCAEYDWVQLGAAIKHPEAGKVFDLSEEVIKDTGVSDAYCKIYCTDGYGNPQLLQQIIDIEKPDAIMHFTDPRFWGWLYNIEHQLRQTMPLMYYNIWDDLPYPHWNEPFYESCDLLLNISRQTNNIVKNVLQKFPKEDWAVQYVPHGCNEKNYYPISALHPIAPEFDKWSNAFKVHHEVDFVIFWNNRNIRRKQPADLILSYKTFCDKLPKEKAKKCILVLKTQAIDDNGTDLPAVIKALCPNYKVYIHDVNISNKEMNFFYNMADVTANIASNEGFGISWCESLHTATPIINNVTGGLQDGCRFEDENGDWVEFTTEFPTNHDGTYRTHGEWAYPVYPSNRSIQGSPQTPYIFDDRVDFKDVAEGMLYWYEMDKTERLAKGNAGYEWVKGDESNMSARRMGIRFIDCMDKCFKEWTPRKRFTLFNTNEIDLEINKVGVI